jgi:DNA polymerase eta
VKEKPAQTKSMLASKNLPQPITNATEGRHWIRVLAAELALRLNNARKVDPTLWPKSIVLHARRGTHFPHPISIVTWTQKRVCSQGYDHARSRQAPFPFKDEVTVDLIASAGDRLWKDLVGAEEDSNTLKISSLQLAFSGLGAAEKGQKTIEGFLKTRDHKRRNSDTLRQDDEGMPASISVSANEHMSGSGGGDGTSFTCPRCGTR